MTFAIISMVTLGMVDLITSARMLFESNGCYTYGSLLKPLFSPCGPRLNLTAAARLAVLEGQNDIGLYERGGAHHELSR